jgi:hypothetical protein
MSQRRKDRLGMWQQYKRLEIHTELLYSGQLLNPKGRHRLGNQGVH